MDWNCTHPRLWWVTVFVVECELPPVGMVTVMEWNVTASVGMVTAMDWNVTASVGMVTIMDWNVPAVVGIATYDPIMTFPETGIPFCFSARSCFPSVKRRSLSQTLAFLRHRSRSSLLFCSSLPLLLFLLVFPFTAVSASCVWCALFRSRNLRTIIRGLPAERRRRSRTWTVSGDPPLDRGRLWVACSSRKPILFVVVCFVQDESRIVSLSLSLSLSSPFLRFCRLCVRFSRGWSVEIRESGLGCGVMFRFHMTEFDSDGLFSFGEGSRSWCPSERWGTLSSFECRLTFFIMQFGIHAWQGRSCSFGT